MNSTQDSLANLRDIHLPSDPTLWPPAPGWWILLLLVLTLLTLLIKIVWRHYQRRKPSKEIERHLAAIDTQVTGVDKVTVLQNVSKLVRRFAIHQFGHHQVAALEGENWLTFLEKASDRKINFRSGVGRILAYGPYQKSADVDLKALQELLLKWVRICHPGNGGKI